jgi:ADP-heptose:LPS heptosyltransferase
MPLTNVKNIALVRRNGLGDMLCVIPLLLYLKERAPQASITLFCDKSNASLLPFLPQVNEVVEFSPGNKYLSVLGCAYRHRSKKFDLAISGKTSPMKLINFFLFTLGARRSIATVDNSWHRRLITDGVSYSEGNARSLHQSLKSLRLLDPRINEIPQRLYPTINIPPAILAAQEKLLCKKLSSLSANVPLLLISLSYNRKSSNPGVDFYVNILNRLHRIHNFRVAVSCLPEDLGKAEMLSKKLSPSSVAIATDNIPSFLTLLDLSDLVFVGDGGIMHLAAAMKKPQVTLFGATLLEEWLPLSNKAICFHHPRTVEEISKEKILQALLRQLNILLKTND